MNDRYIMFEKCSIALALIGRFVAIDYPSGTLFIEFDSEDDATDCFYDEFEKYSSI